MNEEKKEKTKKTKKKKHKNTKSKIKKIVCLTYWALKESPLGEEDDNTLHNKKIRKAGNECTE